MKYFVRLKNGSLYETTIENYTKWFNMGSSVGNIVVRTFTPLKKYKMSLVFKADNIECVYEIDLPIVVEQPTEGGK